MAFESQNEIAKAQRKSKGRTASSPKYLLSLTQKSYDKDDNKKPVLTIRISGEAMGQARFQVGDKVDIAYDIDKSLWRIASHHEKTGGYAISGAKNRENGSIRFTLYEGMKRINETDKACSSRVFSDDQSVNCAAGRIIFALQEDTLIIRE